MTLVVPVPVWPRSFEHPCTNVHTNSNLVLTPGHVCSTGEQGACMWMMHTHIYVHTLYIKYVLDCDLLVVSVHVVYDHDSRTHEAIWFTARAAGCLSFSIWSRYDNKNWDKIQKLIVLLPCPDTTLMPKQAHCSMHHIAKPSKRLLSLFLPRTAPASVTLSTEAWMRPGTKQSPL